MPKIIFTSRFIKNTAQKSVKNYVKYIATREGVVKNFVNYLDERPQSHGLFSDSDEKIILEKVAEEIANHKGNIWSHVVSLKRSDAKKTGYNNIDMWKSLVRRQAENIAKFQKIKLENMRWYAAFHDKETNPHVHIVVYSVDEKEGFLTNKGIEKIRSTFANDIYQDELHFLYEKQTRERDLIKAEARKKLK